MSVCVCYMYSPTSSFVTSLVTQLSCTNVFFCRSMFFWKPKDDESPQEAFDVSKFIQIWPIYINSKLTQQEGRRMPKDSCCKC